MVHGDADTQGSGANGNSYRILEADFGPGLAALTVSKGLKLLAANPPDGCLPFAHTTNYVGAVVLVQRDNCTFQAKARCRLRTGEPRSPTRRSPSFRHMAPYSIRVLSG